MHATTNHFLELFDWIALRGIYDNRVALNFALLSLPTRLSAMMGPSVIAAPLIQESPPATADNRNGQAELYLHRVLDRTDASRDTAAN